MAFTWGNILENNINHILESLIRLSFFTHVQWLNSIKQLNISQAVGPGLVKVTSISIDIMKWNKNRLPPPPNEGENWSDPKNVFLLRCSLQTHQANTIPPKSKVERIGKYISLMTNLNTPKNKILKITATKLTRNPIQLWQN